MEEAYLCLKGKAGSLADILGLGFPPFVSPLHRHARPHHVFIEWRPAVFGHEDWLNEQAHLIDIVPQHLGNVELTLNTHPNKSKTFLLVTI